MSARLSDIEREVLTEALAAPDEGCWDNEPCCWSSAESMFKAVESILAARFAEAEQAAARRLAEVEAERDAYRKAKQENDERFQIEALEQRARAEQAEAALADLRARVEALAETTIDAQLNGQTVPVPLVLASDLRALLAGEQP